MDSAQIFVVVLSFAATFILARVLGRRWRDKRAADRQQQARAGESRQVRRARERRERGR